MEPPFVRPKVEERPQLGVLANAATLFRDGIRDGESLFIRRSRPDCGAGGYACACTDLIKLARRGILIFTLI